MDLQPNEIADLKAIDNSINFDETVFFNDLDWFFHQQNHLGFGQVANVANTATNERTNPLTYSPDGEYLDVKNEIIDDDIEKLVSLYFNEEPVFQPETGNDEMEWMLLDAPENNQVVETNPPQQIDTQAEHAIVAIVNHLKSSAYHLADCMALQAILNSINRHPNRRIWVRTQPVILILDGCLTSSDQTLWIKLTLVTTRRNPQGKTFIHMNEMIYNGENAQRDSSASFYIPLTAGDIHRREKVLRHLSIIKIKQCDYKYELVPYNPVEIDDNIEYYTLPDEEHLTNAQKAKRFDEDYETNAYRIVCELVIKQKDRWFLTDLYCETHTVTDSS